MSADNEKLLLAAMIRTRQLFPDLERPHFKSPDHWRIYKTIMDMRDNGDDINPVSIAVRIEQGDTNAAFKINEIMKHLAHTDIRYILQDGQWAARELVNVSVREDIAQAAKDPAYDYRDIIELAKKMSGRSVKAGLNSRESVERLMDEMKNKTSFYVGFPFIDRLCRGFRKGELVTFMARPAVGKTFALLNIAYSLAHSRRRMNFFSLEMPAASVMERIIQIRNDVSLDFLTEEYVGDIVGDDFHAFWGTTVWNCGVYSVAEMSEAIAKNEAEVAFIDFLGLIQSARSNVSSYERVSQIMIDLKTMAKDRDVLVFLAIQLSRMAEGGGSTVELNHARDSGQIEELSDFVVGMWRPNLGDDGEGRRDISVRLLKNKRGDTGKKTYALTPSGRIVNEEAR